MPLIIGIAFVLWFWLGNPSRDIADWFWGYDAAPWEQVDAFYYPDRTDLRKYKSAPNVGSMDACRGWVRSTARMHDDPNLRLGDYMCAINPRFDETLNMNIYRTKDR